MTKQIYRTAEEAAQILRVSVKSLANSRSTGKGIDIPFVRLNTGAIRYRQSDINAYMKAHFINNSKEFNNEDT
jgi:predicted site-specific integrase-resolvase